MIILDENQKKALTEWIIYALSNLKCDAKQVELLNKYIHTLIKMGSPTDKIKNSLREFLDNRTDGFVDELQDRLNKKDFSFQKEEPPAPPPKTTPPPKQQEPHPKSQAQQSSKPRPSENKKEIMPSSKIKSESLNHTEKTTKKEETVSNASKTEKESKSHLQTKPQTTNQNQTKSQTKNHQQQKPQQSNNHQQSQPNNQHQKTSQVNSLFDEEDLINDDDEEPQSDEAVEKVSEEKIVSKNTEPAPRYIIFIAGIDRNNASIQTLFTLFTKYGRILAIEVNEDEKVAYIEFEELLSAFKAIKSNNKKNLFKNTAVRIDYAIQPDPEKLEDLESEYNKRKQQRQERKQQMLQQQLEQQQKESESKSVNNDEESILEEEDQIKKDIIQKIKDTNEQIKKCTDPAQMEKLKQNLDEYQTMFSEVY